ncbi:MAG: hypothetical protein ABIJ50_08070 [Pseudomonadota bacterium]
MAMYLIDTNVMLAASAVYNVLSNLANDAEPKEADLRELVYLWLRDFEIADHFIVLDEEFLIDDEYKRNMPFNSNMHEQEYGFQVLQSKHDRGLVKYVSVEVLAGNGERIAILSEELKAIVTDREDRKWVAVAESAQILLMATCPIAYGAESDWYRIEDDLIPHGIVFHRLLPDEWYEEKMARDKA